MTEKYKLLLQIKDHIGLVYDDEEYDWYRDAIVVAIFVAKYGYPWGQEIRPVILVQVISFTKEMFPIRGAWLTELDYEDYKNAGLLKL